MADLLRYNKKQKYLLFDYETESLNLVPGFNKPWQLSYLIAEGNQIQQEFDFYIDWPDLNISKEAALVTRFDFNKYKLKAMPAAKILEDFESYLYDPQYIIVGQNLLGFDVYVHNQFRKKLGNKTDFSFIKRIIDTNCVAKAIKKSVAFKDTDNRINWMYKFNDFRERGLKTSIKQQLKEYEIPFDEMRLHDSAYDIQMNFEIFKKQLWQVELR